MLLCMVLLAGIAGLVVVSFSLPGFTTVRGDEYLLPWYGKQVAGGRVPYVDFFVFLGPFAPYAAGLVTWVAGAGLVPFNTVLAATTAAATCGLFATLSARGQSTASAALAAAWLPLVIMTFWPYSNHEWLASHATVLAVWAVHASIPPAAAGFLGGFLTATAGLIVQPFGLVSTAVLGLLILEREGWERATLFRAAAAGFALAFGIAFACLVAQGAVVAFVENAIIWPLTHYRQPGGFNDGAFLDLMAPRLTSFLSYTIPGVDVFSVVLLLLLVVGTLAIAAAGVPGSKDRARARTCRAALLLTLWILFVFRLGRTDMVHLAFYSPLLVGILGAISARDDAAQRLVRSLFTVGTLLALSQWAWVWSRTPPSPSQFTSVDARVREALNRNILAHLPGVVAGNLPIVYLGQIAPAVYLHWSPEMPPVDFILAPSARVNANSEYEALARFIRMHDVRYVIVSAPERAFLTDPSAIRDLLETDYRVVDELPLGLVLTKR